MFIYIYIARLKMDTVKNPVHFEFFQNFWLKLKKN